MNVGSLWVLAARTLVVVGLCIAACAASPTQAASVPEPIQLVEGSVIALPQLLVTLTGQKWFYAKPLYASGPTIAVHADADPPPTSGWTVNVTGRVLSSSGKLFVYATRLELLIDPRTQMPCPPPVAGSVWADVRDIPLNLDAPTEGLAPPDPSSLIPIREPVEAAPGSIALALARADASTMTVMDVGHGSPDSSQVTLTGKVVTATRGEFPGHIYVEEPDRRAGIRVKWSGAYEPARGDVVDVSGVIDTASDGERVIDADTGTPHGVTFVQSGTPLTPLGMTNRSIGGGAFNQYTPGVNYPTGSGTGPFNKGLLVKSWGRVTSVNRTSKLFYINDGSFPDGIKVSWAWPTSGKPALALPQVGWKIGVTGLSSSEVSGSNMVRVLRPRNQADLGVYDPADAIDPTIEITSPKDTTWHKASGATSIVISGTADDYDTYVVKVEVKIGGGQYQPATYNSVAKTWQYTWQSPSSTTVWARATDFAGNDAETSVDVTIVNESVIYVNGARPDDNGNGLSWATAKKTIESGLAAASTGYHVWVAEGTYWSYGITHSKSGVGLYGGFSANETAREQRNWATNRTAIDGSGHYPVLTISGNSASVDGFAIQNGTYGLRCTDVSAVTIANCIIRDNHTDSYNGRGVEVASSSAILVGNVIADNTGYSSGGGLRCWNSTVQLVNNTIVRNAAPVSGGGIYSSGGSVSLSNNIVAYNTGGGITATPTAPTCQSNDVWGNSPYNYSWITPPATHPSGDLEPADPLITYIDYFDWHIAGNSPCRDCGAFVSGVPSLDMDLEPRPYEAGSIDVGADEWTGADPAIPVIHVRPPSEGGNDVSHHGTSWTDAVATVQKGVDLVYERGIGEVWVAAGTYNEAVSMGYLHSYIGLYGGFDDQDTSKEERDWNANVTILDGQSMSNPILNVLAVSQCQVDGFTIRNANRPNQRGGGIRCVDSSITVANNTIVNNLANHGAGISMEDSSGEIRQNLFQSNTDTFEGAGVFCADSSPLTIAGNIFADNSSVDHGGAIALEGGVTRPVIVNNLFLRNQVTGGVGGGAVNALDAVPWIINNTFVGNHATSTSDTNGNGGAIILRRTSSVTLYNNVFYDNYADRAGHSVYADENCGTQAIAFCDAWNTTGSNDPLTHYKKWTGSVYVLVPGVDSSGSCQYVDPLFVSVVLGDYRLTYLPPNVVSPCIDRGANPAAAPYDKIPVIDLDGSTRPVDIPGVTNYGTNAFSDIGAYEVQN